MPIVATTLKNTLTQTVIRIVGSGTHTISLAGLVTNTKKKAAFALGDTVVVVADTLGIVVGGKVVGTGIPANTVVTAIHQNKVTLDNATTLASDSNDYTFDSQKYTANASAVNISKVFYDTDLSGGIKVERDSVTELSLSRSGSWSFDGFSLTNNNTKDIVITHSGAIDSTLIIELKKAGGFGDSEHPIRN